MSEDWHGRWQEGRIGWHERGGNAGLREYWPQMPQCSSVLVPLCGKSVDLLWLAERGLDVHGVELSAIAIRDFFRESGLGYEEHVAGDLLEYRATDHAISLYCGDYFDFHSATGPFAALFDRGALVAVPESARPAYVAKTKSLLAPGARQLLVTMEYDQAMAAGPPFSVGPKEVNEYWPDLVCMHSENDIDNCPPKFRAAGLESVMESIWLSTA